MKRSDIYTSEVEYAFVAVKLDQKSVTSNALGGPKNTAEGLLAHSVRQLKAGCLQQLKCNDPLPRQFFRLKLPTGHAEEKTFWVNRIIDGAAKDLLKVAENCENPSAAKYSRLLLEASVYHFLLSSLPFLSAGN